MTPDLRGPRLLLRLFGPEQISDRYLAWLNDPEVNRFSRRRDQAPTDMSSALSYLNGLRPNEMIFGIHMQDHGHVGNIKLGPIDFQNRRCDISILIGERSVWGMGIGREAVWVASCFLFGDKRLNRVDAGSCNPAFIRLALSLGWKVEGVLRQYVRLGDEFLDYTILSQLAGECPHPLSASPGP